MRGVEFVPVEGDPDSGFVGRDGQVIFDHQRPGRVLIDREAVHFQPAGIGLGGDQADMELLHPMAADRDAMLPRKLRHLQPTGNAAAI